MFEGDVPSYGAFGPSSQTMPTGMPVGVGKMATSDSGAGLTAEEHQARIASQQQQSEENLERLSQQGVLNEEGQYKMLALQQARTMATIKKVAIGGIIIYVGYRLLKKKKKGK